jgi:hypothetical protein
LRCARRNTALAQQRAKRRAKRVHVERAAPFVSLGDTGCPQIPVKDAKQASRDIE